MASNHTNYVVFWLVAKSEQQKMFQSMLGNFCVIMKSGPQFLFSAIKIHWLKLRLLTCKYLKMVTFLTAWSLGILSSFLNLSELPQNIQPQKLIRPQGFINHKLPSQPLTRWSGLKTKTIFWWVCSRIQFHTLYMGQKLPWLVLWDLTHVWINMTQNKPFAS